MRVWVGDKRIQLPAWRGSCYPEKLPAADHAGLLRQQLPTVKSTTPSTHAQHELLEHWSAATPADFISPSSANRRITHELRLHEAESAVEPFRQGAVSLGSKLGPVLFQLPPWLHKDLERLDAFLAVLAQVGQGIRRPSSFVTPRGSVTMSMPACALPGLRCASPKRKKLETPLQATTSWGYLRLRREDYTPATLDAWASRIAEQPWSEAYVFIKHETAEAPGLARRLLDAFPDSSSPMAERKCRPPKLPSEDTAPLARGPGAGDVVPLNVVP